MKFPVFILTIFIISFIGCKSTQLPPDKYDKSSITFGSGGGFSGAYHEYILLDDGRLYATKLDGSSPEFIKNVENKITGQLFDNIKTFGLDKFNYNEPQNLYYFLKYKSQRDSSNIVWSGMPDGKIAIAYSMYRILIEQTQSKK